MMLIEARAEYGYRMSIACDICGEERYAFSAITGGATYQFYVCGCDAPSPTENGEELEGGLA